MAQKAEMNLINPSTGLYEPYHLQTEPDMILGWARKESTAYAVGDVVRLSALDVNKKLVCVKAGTSAAGNLTVSSTAEGALVTDGTCVWEVDSFADGDYTAPHQNGIYRGADLTAYWQSGYMSTNIRAGKFVGMHIGDYIVKTVDLPAITYTDKAGVSQTQAAQTFSNVEWLLAGFDSNLLAGSTMTSEHHVVMIANEVLQRHVKMNPTDSTEGGYIGSDMWRVHMPNWSTAIKNAFGASHVLKHDEQLPNAIDPTAVAGGCGGRIGASSSQVWTMVEVNIPNEQMIFGNRVSGSFFDCGNWPQQLPYFHYKQYTTGAVNRGYTWLRVVASTSAFASANAGGNAAAWGASGDGGNEWLGIRPYFLYY